jgi:Tol biopolymer transport system component
MNTPSIRVRCILVRVVPLLLAAASGAPAADFTSLNAGNYQQHVAWSHDGHNLAVTEEWFRITSPYCCEAGIRLGVILYGQLHFLTGDDNGSFVSPPDFAPGGSIVFASGYSWIDTTISEDLYVISPAGGGLRLTSHPGFDGEPSVSPDGMLVAFTSDRGGNRDLWIVPGAGGEAWQLTTHPGLDSDPSWSPDGRRIAFTSDRSGNQDIWVMPALGGPATALTADPARDRDPSWSPDGELLAFTSDRSGNDDIWVVRVANGAVSQLTTDPTIDHRPAWSPDGERIAFVSGRSGYSHVWIASNLRTVHVEAVSWAGLKSLYR